MQPCNVYVCSFSSSVQFQELSGPSRLCLRSHVVQELRSHASCAHVFCYARTSFHSVVLHTSFFVTVYIVQSENRYNVIRPNDMHSSWYLWFNFMGFGGSVTDGKQRHHSMLQKFADQGACIGREEAWERIEYAENMASDASRKFGAIVNINHWSKSACCMFDTSTCLCCPYQDVICDIAVPPGRLPSLFAPNVMCISDATRTIQFVGIAV